MFRVGLSGTNWTGKTETIKRLLRGHSELAIRTVSLSSLIDRCPFPMIEEQTVEGSKWMVKQVSAICADNDGGIELFDRTPLDILAFTLYALNRTGERNQAVLEDCLGLVRHFDCLFYLPVSDEWPVNTFVSPGKIHFALKIDSYIRKAIEQFSLDVVSLPWGLAEREVILSEYLSGMRIA
jgi:hypothetical protein